MSSALPDAARGTSPSRASSWLAVALIPDSTTMIGAEPEAEPGAVSCIQLRVRPPALIVWVVRTAPASAEALEVLEERALPEALAATPQAAITAATASRIRPCSTRRRMRQYIIRGSS